jgi:iron-sulfur cluster repair protein YtfE (RIC family)
MTLQHEQHRPELARLLRALAQVRRDPHDEIARGELAAVAKKLETEFERHLVLEETEIFPAIAELPPATQARMVEELRQRRRPDSSRGHTSSSPTDGDAP